jgi:outer membrane protein
MLKHSILVISLIYATSTWATSVVAGDDKPQSLADIYNQALAHDPTLASALSANQAAQEIIEQGKALYRPQVNFNAGTSASRTDVNFFGLGAVGAALIRNGGQSFAGYQYGIEARQPIYRKQNLVQMDQAKTQVSQADKQLNLTQQTLILRTTQAYFDVLLAQDKIGLMQAQKAAILSQLEQAKANFDVGTATITDVNDAQARYDLIVAQEIAAITTIKLHYVQCRRLPEKFRKNWRQ